MDYQKINSPDGIALLMENAWLRHRAGLGRRRNNVYMVELPPLSSDDMPRGSCAGMPQDEDDEPAAYCVYI